MEDDLVLKLEIRKKIYNHILNYPGIHERQISRDLEIPLSTVDYHLYFLKKRNLISAIKTEGYVRYYCNTTIGHRDKQILGILRQKTTRRIIMFLLLNPESLHKSVYEYMNIALSTTSFHLNNLVKLNVIERKIIGGEKRYSVIDPEYVSDLLIVYKKSFLDVSVNDFVENWVNLHPKYIKKQKK